MSLGDAVQSKVSIGFSVTSIVANLTNSPTDGNLLILTASSNVANRSPVTPVGFKPLTKSNSLSASWFWYYKVSDGSEQNVTVDWGTSGSHCSHYAELHWNGSIPTVDTNHNTDNIGLIVKSQVSGSLVPAKDKNLLIAVHGSRNGPDNRTGQAISSPWTITTQFNNSAVVAELKIARLGNASGLQEATHTDNDVGSNMYGAIASFIPSENTDRLIFLPEKFSAPELLIPNRKPIGNVEVDQKEFLSRYIAGFWLHRVNDIHVHKDVANNIIGVNEDPTKVFTGIDEHGTYTEFNNLTGASTCAGFDLGDPPELRINRQITIMQGVKLRSEPGGTGWGRGISKTNGTTGDNWGVIFRANSGALNREIRFRINNNELIGPQLNAEQYYDIACRYHDGRRIIYVDGVNVASDTYNGSGISTGGNVKIGNHGSAVDRGLRGDIYYTIVFSTSLTDEEIRYVQSNIYRFLKPKAAPIYLDIPEPSETYFPPKAFVPELLVPNRKPVGPVEIDKENKYGKYVDFYVPFINSNHDIARSVLANQLGDVDRIIDYDSCSYFPGDGAATDQLRFPLDNGFDQNKPYTIFAKVKCQSFIDLYAGLINFKTINQSRPWQIVFSPNVNYNITFGEEAQPSRFKIETSEISTAELTDGQWKTLAITYNGGLINAINSYKFYWNGEEKTISLGGAFGAIINETSLGGNSSTTQDYNGSISFVTRMPGIVLSHSDVISLTKNPYQFLKPKSSPLQLAYDPSEELDGIWLPDPRLERPEHFILGRKPVGPVVIDWEHSLAKGLTNFGLVGENIDVANKSPIQLINSPSNIWTSGVDNGKRAGIVYDDGTGTPHIETNDITFSPVDLGYTMFFHLKHDVVTAGSLELLPNAWRSYGTRISLNNNAGNYQIAFVHNQVGTDHGVYMVQTRYPSNSEIIFAVSSHPDGTGFIVLDNIVAQASGMLAPVAATGDARSKICTQIWGQGLYGAIHSFGKFNRAMSKDELLKLVSNPYQFLIPA